MTEPDEALLYARESAYRKVLEAFGGDETEALAQLETEDAQEVVNWLATTYRAGAAASEARIKELEEKNAAFAKRIKALKGAIDQLLSAYERLDSYEVKSTELWAAYHFALNIYDDFVWSPEENAEEADQ